jgi:hypothetical protein
MLIVLSLAAAYAGWRTFRFVRDSLRDLPRRNEDMVLF